MLQPGDVLRNRYRIESFLGRGGMSDVYLAFDLRRQVHVAVKVLREDLAEDPEFVRRFRREAEALAQLDHPYIVRFYSFERQGHVAFIVMDYVPGVTLRRRLLEAEGPLPLEEATRILQHVGSALQYAHNEGFIHRDIKSGNIMLREDGTALLTDFGIARVAESATMTMGMVGTPAYMSPEQIRGEEVDHRTDIYSLGVVLYEMVTGRRPFSGGEGSGTSTIERIRRGHLHETPPDPRRFNPTLPVGAAQVILRALEKDREERWSDVASMVQAWEDAVGVRHARMARGSSVSRGSPQGLQGGERRVGEESTGGGMEKEGDGVERHVGRRHPVGWLVGGLVVLLVGLLVALGSGVLSGGGASAGPSPVMSVDVEGTARALAARYAAETAEAEAVLATRTAEARKTIEALAATRVAATASALAATVTAGAGLTATREAQKQATATRRAHLTQTAVAAMRATATRVAVLAAQQTRSAEFTRQAERMTATAMAMAATATAQASLELHCELSVYQEFVTSWKKYRGWLGCPISFVQETGGATQRFQYGRMVWRENLDRHYVLYSDRSWEEYPDEYEEGMPEPPTPSPPSGMFAPVRGFGVVWRSHLGAQNSRIGWALEKEYWSPLIIQDFDKGVIFRLEGKIYVLGVRGKRWDIVH